MKKYILCILLIILLIPAISFSAPVEKYAKNTIELSSIDGPWTMPKAKHIIDVILYPGATSDVCIIRDINGAAIVDAPVTIPLKTDSDMRPQIYEGKGIKHRLYLDFSDARTSLSAGAVIIMHVR